MTRPRNATLSALPLYATDEELAQAILGKRANDWPMLLALYEPRGFPKISPLTGGRYVPAVLQFFDAKEGVGGNLIPATDGAERPWPTDRKARRRA
jgi:hypothetical protein